MQLLTQLTTKSTATTTTGCASTANSNNSAINTNANHQTKSTGKMDKFYPPRPKINAFNELFKCQLCQGYLINPTTIDACTHTYCRSCIVRHLSEDEFCPQCKGNGGKTLSPANLKSDNVLRSIVYKLVPGLYQKERERIVQFVNNTKNEAPQPLGGSPPEPLSSLLESDDDFITARDSISLSLEFHPFLASQCDEADVPPVRYLKCPASLKITHLKRFLCSKFDIDPCNRRVDIEIIYEDEVLPSDFTLMDVAYCYQYKGQSPLKLFYRILLFNDEQLAKPEHKEASVEKVSPEPSTTNLELRADSGLETKKAIQNSSSLAKAAADARTKSSSSSPFITPSAPTSIGSSSNSSKVKSHKSSASKPVATPPSVKMTLSSRPAESKKSVSKKSSLAEDFTLPTTTTNDFKSLRSNDIRYSHYAVTASTTAPPTPAAATTTVTTGSKVKVKAPKEEKHASSKCDIVVSIPHNQMQDEWDSKPLSQLKTASKKSPNTPPAALSYSTVVEETKPTDANKKVRNVPKLKIELNSLKTKLIEKPKSADIRLDTLMITHPHKPRKFSLDEPQAIANDKVDLQTYVKNIGLKPIEVQTNTSTPTTPHTPLETELSEKFTPNASPRSSCSSSTTSSSNGYLHVTGEISKSSSSSHKKRKKKHSKEPRDSKRKKMHAEISSHAADESLKMKVKLTTPLSIKPSKLESKKSPPSSDKTEGFFFAKPPKSPETKIKLAFEPLPPSKETQEKPKEKLKTPSDKKAKDALKLQPLAIKTCKDFEDDDDISMLPDITTSLSLSKPLTNLKDSKLPHSPPLPPSLFKTTPLTFSTFTPNVVTAPKSKSVVTPAKPAKDPKPVQPIRMKTLAPKPMPASKPLAVPIKPPQFAVPNLPKLMASNSSKFLNSTPSSIASSASKQMGNLLKRSASMDEGKSMAKHPKLDKPHQITVSAYGSNLQVTRVEVPATPTSSTAKATYEIPLYSPLSASYNPKCTFSVGSSSAGGRTQTGALTSASPTAVAKAPMFTTSMATKKPEKDKAKAKSSPSGLSYGSSKTSPVMGPPLSLGKLNTEVPMSVKSPPVPTLSANKALSPSLGMVNSRPGLSACQVTEKKTDATISSSLKASNNGPLEKPSSSSLRQFRLPSRESAQDILDLSAAPKSANGLPAAEKKSPAATTAGSSLELALTKIKQNISNNNNNNNNHQESKPSQLDLKPNSDDLQNLHLLSESATAREKIAINSPTSSVPCSLYDKAKINQNSLVRQQNASVRSIPNPSALAFRNHQPANTIPMVTIAAPLVSALTNADADKSLLSKPLSPLSAMPQSPNFTTSSRNTSSATSLTTKRHPSIDQVAASLNIRATAAAAAEAATAKSSLKQLDEMAIVTSTSSLAETNGGSKLKQIKQETVEQTPTAAANSSSHCQQPSSTVHSAMATSSEVVEIKKEPEDRFSDSSAMADEPRDQVNALFAAAKSSSGSGSTGAATTAMPVPSSLVSKVENLVTSVINVSTPTSSLLTTSSAGF
ncbi:protein suppressor 2 of zeste [Stomoxys calcitrans]|uniref:protein suppressor 2 of zeste n=1 Tax=Stomoxys calcitrans TaxID=35570 RepID=UPI0027E3306A|nr:protein suppressor 2 of zeste [Stomoxys calcitrans]XP_059225029.1 protein suppressor 2 of zeste [Stomoxys calcitrans]